MQCGGREPAAISRVDYEEVNVCHYYGSNPGCLYAVASAKRRLKDAYSTCTNTAEGNPDKSEACFSIFNMLKQEKPQ
jgi:hypothetical protein